MPSRPKASSTRRIVPARAGGDADEGRVSGAHLAGQERENRKRSSSAISGIDQGTGGQAGEERQSSGDDAGAIVKRSQSSADPQLEAELDEIRLKRRAIEDRQRAILKDVPQDVACILPGLPGWWDNPDKVIEAWLAAAAFVMTTPDAHHEAVMEMRRQHEERAGARFAWGTGRKEMMSVLDADDLANQPDLPPDPVIDMSVLCPPPPGTMVAKGPAPVPDASSSSLSSSAETQ